MSGSQPDAVPCPSNLVPRLLHDLSQCASALICSLEVSSLRCRSVEEHVEALHTALELAQAMQKKIVFFRDVSAAQSRSFRVATFLPGSELETVQQEMHELAESMGASLAMHCAADEVWGSKEKFHLGLTHLLDWVIACRRPAGIEIRIEARLIGEIRVDTGHRDRAAPSAEGLEIASAALSSMNADLHIYQQEPRIRGAITFARLEPVVNNRVVARRRNAE